MSYHYVNVPVAEMRAEPHARAEVISQALFSEQVQPFEEKGDWIRIETLIDAYQGWVRKGTFCRREHPFLTEPSKVLIEISRNAAHLYNEPETVYGPMLTLPFESRLQLIEPLENSESRWLKVELPDGREGYIQRGDVAFGFNSRMISRQEMCELSHRFLGLPYTWGGRSSFGYDCSGFVQMLYRRMGVFLPRDSSVQCNWNGVVEAPVEALQSGDLLYFGYSADKIRHVGLYLGNRRFIHAVAKTENAPYIRVSSLEDAAWNGSGYYPYCTGRMLRGQ